MQHGSDQWFRNLEPLEQAARSAVGCWFTTEQGLCEAVQDARNGNEIFPKKWFGYWGVARTLRTSKTGGDREAVRDLLFKELARLKAALPNEQGYGLVEELSKKIQQMNCGVRPTSLVSKF